jgi:hypothetical protein
MRNVTATLVTLLVLAGAREAHAQLHWDLGVHGGVAKRFLTHKGGAGASALGCTGCPDGFLGPMVGVQAHLALLPFVRAGVYGQFEVSPLDGGPSAARDLFAFGVQGKVMSPWPRGDWRLWLTLGVGYVAVHAPGYPFTLRNASGAYPVTVDPSGGGFLEVPIGVGLSYRLRKPFFVYAELMGRFGGGFWGTLYGENGGRNATSATYGRSAIAPAGNDFFSLGLAVGVGLDM